MEIHDDLPLARVESPGSFIIPDSSPLDPLTASRRKHIAHTPLEVAMDDFSTLARDREGRPVIWPEVSMDPRHGHIFSDEVSHWFRMTRCGECRLRTRRWQQCQVCGMCVHATCRVTTSHHCAPTTIVPSEGIGHHWIPITLILPRRCQRCRGWILGFLPVVMSCSRCGVVTHGHAGTCRSHTRTVGALGRHDAADMIDHCRPWFAPVWPNSSFPGIVALVNTKSGGGLGAAILPALMRHLGPHQVYDIDKIPSTVAVARHLKAPNTRVIVCGGDGSVGSLLSELHTDDVIGVSPPLVGILPLGTGNDLSRALMWGSGFQASTNVLPWLRACAFGTKTQLDRWELVTDSPTENRKFTNNFSWGLDPKISYKFNQKRRQSPHLFTGQGINTLWYLHFFRSCRRGNPWLGDFPLQVDGVDVFIPNDVVAIATVNISSYMGGVDVWSKAHGNVGHPQVMDDGKVEIVGFTGSAHLLGVALGVAQPIRLAQGKEVMLRIPSGSSLHLETDGEPWLEVGPTVCRLRWIDRSDVIAPPVGQKL